MDVTLLEQETTCKKDISVINSQDIAVPEEGTSTQTGKSGEDIIISIQDSDRQKEDWEMYEDSNSFWEDGQRLTDSWYGIEKVTEEKVPDDSYDEMCLQVSSKVENNLNHASNDDDAAAAAADDDDDDNLCIQGLLNVENNNFNNRNIMNINVAIDDDDAEFDEEFDKVVENYQYQFL